MAVPYVVIVGVPTTTHPELSASLLLLFQTVKADPAEYVAFCPNISVPLKLDWNPAEKWIDLSDGVVNTTARTEPADIALEYEQT
jgi:hypothetical protein